MKILKKTTIAGLLALSIVSCQAPQEDRAAQMHNAASNTVANTIPDAAPTVMPQTNFDNGLVKPWNDENRAFVLDGKKFNFENVKWEDLGKDKRIAGVIFRATGPDTPGQCTNQSKLISEPGYDQIKDKAKSQDFLWGSYHVGLSGKIKSPSEQAKLYLETAKPSPDEVIALDLEDFSVACYMNLAEAREFIQYIFDQTGRYPLVYVTGSIFRKIIEEEKGTNSIFAKTPLWFARYETNITGCFNDPNRIWWGKYDLWQFASERNCGDPPRKSETFCEEPRKRRTPCPFEQSAPDKTVPWVPGVKNDIDINIYNGTKEELKKAWMVNFNQ